MATRALLVALGILALAILAVLVVELVWGCAVPA
jgi:hypothetical protein